MPRRPSASVGPSAASTPSSSTILVHRTTESHHAFSTPSQNQSLQTLGANVTPQQKIVQVLVHRLRQKLPCNSGLSLERVETEKATLQAVETLVELSRDSLDMIAWALSELLDRLAKQIDPHTGHLTIEVLQSQLFILKVLSMTMASRWSQPQASNSRSGASSTTDPLSSPDSPASPSAGSGRRQQAASEHSAASAHLWQEPPPLDDSCVKYILSVMVLFMRQTATPEVPLMLQTRSTDISFRDYEETISDTVDMAPNVTSGPTTLSPEPALRPRLSVNSVRSSKVSIKANVYLAAANTAYEKTHVSLSRSSLAVNTLIAKYVGRIIFHISASNWSVVHDRLSSKISFLASPKASEISNPDVVDLHLISYSILDRQRLVVLLNQLSSLMVNMRSEAQKSIAVHLRSAIFNWIDIFPGEYNDAIRTRGRTEGAPERVFDLLYNLLTPGTERIFWPALAMLNCTSADRIDPNYNYNTGSHKGKKELKFIDNINKHITSNSKLSEIALACVVDLCRCAAYVESDGDVPLRLVAADVAHDIKAALYHSGVARKPFWEAQDDIDIALYGDALVCIFRFLPPEDSGPIFRACMEPERSDPVKTCAIRACLTLSQDAHRFPHQRPLKELADMIAARCREILGSVGLRRSEIDMYGIAKRPAARPRAKRIWPEPLTDREVLILGILSLWRSNSVFFTNGITTAEEINDWSNTAVRLWEAPLDVSVKVSTSSTLGAITESAFKPVQMEDESARLVLAIVQAAMPITLISVVGNLLASRASPDSQRQWITLAHQVIELYVSKSDSTGLKEVQTDPKRIPAFALAEIAFLVALTSAENDISHMAATSLRLLSHAERQQNAPVNTIVNDEDRSKRNPVYEQLGDPRITVAGRLTHQKRMRKLVRMLTFSAGIHVVVWEECYWRWRALNELIVSTLNDANCADGAESIRSHMIQQEQDVRYQWQNLTLFLAALAGSCLQLNQDFTLLAKVIPPKYLPDKMRVIQNPIPLIEAFIGDLVNLLHTGDIQIRDIIKDAFGTELSPRLVLVKLEDASEATDMETFTLVLDQIVTILKLVTENSEVTLEDVMNVDINSAMLTLCSIINRFSGTPSANRLKIKYCNLCEVVCSRGDTLTIRKDSPVRHQILERILIWMSTAKAQSDSSANDLSMACLGAIVKLLDRLQLSTADPSNAGDDSGHVVSRLFNKYSTALLSSLESFQPDVTGDGESEQGSINQKIRASQKEAELRELVITGLTSLVISNSESGFKQCLPLAYDQDNRKRTIFAHVFARVISQGTVFDPLEKAPTKARQQALCDLVRGSDMVLALTICEICPPGEVEMMISVLLNIFDTRASLLALLKLMIEREVAQTENETALFRSNSTCTRFLSAFARIHGYQYLRNLVEPLLKAMQALPPGSGYEIDPTRVSTQDVHQNQKTVEHIAATFLSLLSSSLPALPWMFREIMAHIVKVVMPIWPESKYSAMGAFIFLRFISPAVVAPETIDIEVPKSENVVVFRRGLMKHIPSEEEKNDQWTGTISDPTDVIVLHRFFHKHADKIGKELLSLSRPSVDGESSAVAGKRAWDGLCALLVDLGPPLEAPKFSLTSSGQNREYLEFMERHANRDTTSMARLFLEVNLKPQEAAIFVLRLSNVDVEILDIELLLYHILKTLTSELNLSRSFDIIVDCTSFASASEVPLQWLKFCAELIPYDIRTRFDTVRVLNANGLMQQYLRRLYNVSAGSPFCRETKIYTSVADLIKDVPPATLQCLIYPFSLEQETHEDFFDVTMKTTTRTPVHLLVCPNHIRVTSVKSLPVSPALACKSTEIILLMDVSDIYNVSTGQEPHEFIIRRRQGVTVYFSSPSREQIVKSIRSAKGRQKDAAQAPLAERFSRFSNVPATLLHIGFLSVDLNDEELRGAAYDLLGAVCVHLKYDKSPIVAPKAGFISGDPVAFVSRLSERLAEFAPQLSLDFIHEVSAAMTSMDKSSTSQRISCLQYMSPWIQNLSHFANCTHPLYERSGARLRDCIRTLAEISLTFPEITSTIQKHIWSEVAKLDSNILDIILDELVRTATDGGIGTRRCETISHIVAALSSIHVRGRIYSKLRKSLSKVPPKFTASLLEHPNWNEISTLIRLALVVGSQSTQTGINYLYVPEIVHLVSLVAAEGPVLVRKSVYGIVMNLLQCLYIARADDSTESGLMQLINDCTLPETLRLFGLKRETPTSEYSIMDHQSDREYLERADSLVLLLIRILSVSAGNTGLLNVWRARWLGLVTATAFQQSPAVQTKAFVALSALAIAEVDDDFLYQILVAFKSALSKANENNTMTIVSMLRCMCKIVPAIVDTSRYISVLFWLAVALLQASHVNLFIEATCLLRITLENMESHGMFIGNSVQDVLLEAREQLEEVTSQLDELLKLNFETNFSIALASIIFKGMRHTFLKESAVAVLRSLLRVTTTTYMENIKAVNGQANGVSHAPCYQATGYFLALVPVSTTPKSFRQLLKDANLDEYWIGESGLSEDDEDAGIPQLTLDILGVNDPNTALLVASFIGTMLGNAQGDDAETQMLYGLLASIANSYPDIISTIYDTMQDRIKDTFANSSNPAIIRAVSNVFRVALQDNIRSSNNSHGSTSTLGTVEENNLAGRSHLNALDELGMQGLALNFTFLPPHRGVGTKMINWIPTLVTLMIS
ncbi:hypothetical protein BDN70DRAFT_931958 [Pholiota conissans]|uniref:Ras-GAP domain-containing protein n=1 Tax=Pholiota conissans TaxID=109636 RepID=A0A9P6D1G6_9AGAR|nr:hypothetical protein BDN70DRAFT_931958 [Pholiota conissans]